MLQENEAASSGTIRNYGYNLALIGLLCDTGMRKNESLKVMLMPRRFPDNDLTEGAKLLEDIAPVRSIIHI